MLNVELRYIFFKRSSTIQHSTFVVRRGINHQFQGEKYNGNIRGKDQWC